MCLYKIGRCEGLLVYIILLLSSTVRQSSMQSACFYLAFFSFLLPRTFQPCVISLKFPLEYIIVLDQFVKGF